MRESVDFSDNVCMRKIALAEVVIKPQHRKSCVGRHAGPVHHAETNRQETENAYAVENNGMDLLISRSRLHVAIVC